MNPENLARRQRSFTLWPCVLLAAALLSACQPPPAAVEPVRAVRTWVVGTAPAQSQLEFAAEVRARVESRLGFRVPGKLVERPAQLGQTVRAGQVLGRLDPQDLKLGQDAARAALGAAKAQSDVAESEFKRFVTLREQGFISGAELERREATVKSARAAVEQAEAQWRVQANQSGYSTLAADATGVITAVEAEPGMVLSAGAPVVRLAHDGPRDAWFNVPEDRLAAVRALQGRSGQLKVKGWGPDARTWPATVREIAAAADPATRTFLVKADLGSAPLALGQTATVLLPGPAAPAALMLPLTALFEHQGKTQVWVLDRSSMTVQMRPVQPVAPQGNQIVIAGGLQPGDTIVTAGVHTLTAGQKVTLYVEPKP
ncbi:MAG: efflux RND transporter periplasmic adaptor subunit [Rubrivivax sp.]|jgi:RND family efflux transporter MFP subunit|nr:efflux RND transporter periplasmic adaptor subunit [Rubrivivax sp.]